MKKYKDLDPFYRTKVKEQLDVILKLDDTSKDISGTTKEIGDLVSTTEQMIRQKAKHQDALRDTRSLIESRLSMNDIDITDVKLPLDNLVKKEILPNQVVGVRSISSKLNMSIVSQKTIAVIRRVNQMVNRNVVKKDTTHVSLNPELVIVPSVSSNVVDLEFEDMMITEPTVSQMVEDETQYEELEDVYENDEEEEQSLFEQLPLPEIGDKVDVGDNLFKTVTPFSEPLMFADRVDESAISTSSKIIEFPLNRNEIDEKELTAADISNEIAGSKLPQIIDFPVIEGSDNVDDFSRNEDASNDNFWVTYNDGMSEDSPMSFDDQIIKLLSTENVGGSKVRKKAA